jgi:Fe-S oxidoreductase
MNWAAMSRPDLRPMHRLPVLEAKRTSLETCVFCPKLCRSACPVSNVEATETLTPWGKMSSAYFVARGDVAPIESFTRTSLACTGCHACRELCDHENDVAGTLLTARAGEAALGVLPESARNVGRTFSRHQARTREAIRRLSAHAAVRGDAATALLVGCTYARKATPEATSSIAAATGVLREPVALVDECCGLPLLYAGEASAFAKQAEKMAEAVSRFARVVVVDAGCASALRLRYAEVGTLVRPKVELLVELAANDLAKLTPVPDARDVRYHDPCQLGRGLGVYEAPRRVLARVIGRASREFTAEGKHGACSGGGGLLPVTMPETAQRIAAARQAEHRECGGGEIVTACASSLLELRKGGPDPVSDLVSWIARAVQPFAP